LMSEAVMSKKRARDDDADDYTLECRWLDY
jgi:hypothetical protein